MTDRRKWAFIPLGFIIFMCMGTIYSWSVFKTPIEKVFQISSTESGLPYMFFLAFYAFTMPVAGNYIEKLGPRKITMIGGLIVSLGWILSSFATSITFLVITYGIVAGTGVGIAYGAPMAVSAKWFPQKKGFAVGLTLAGFGLSPFITAPIANKLVALYGPFMAFRYLGIAFAVIIGILALPLKFPNQNESHLSVDEKSFEGKNLRINEAIKTKQFYGLWITYMIGTLIGLMAIGISSPVAIEIVNTSPNKAAILVSFFAIFNGIGRPIFGSLTDKLKARTTAIISFLMMIGASILMLVVGADQVILYSIAFSIFWLNLGGWLAIAPTATNQFFGHKNYSSNYGYVFTAYGIGALAGGFISGRIRDVFGTYRYVFYPTLLLAAIGIIVSFLLLKSNNNN